MVTIPRDSRTNITNCHVIRGTICCLTALIVILNLVTLLEIGNVDPVATATNPHIADVDYFNFTAKTNNAMLHSLYHDAISKMKSSPSDHIQIQHDINGDEVIYDDDRGMIWGNPLLIPKCFQSLHHDIDSTEWLMTRERILKHQSTGSHKYGNGFLIRRAKQQTDGNGTRYLNIEKSASSTMTKVSTEINGMKSGKVRAGRYYPGHCVIRLQTPYTLTSYVMFHFS